LYLAGLLLAVGRFLGGAWRMTRMVRQARPAGHAGDVAAQVRGELGIGREVRVLESASVPVPMTWGVTAPVVLLPDAARMWPPERLHAVLLHEMVHVARYDLLAQRVAQAACCLYWFHPLAWIAARRLRMERERACDDAVLDRGVAAPDYAGHLMELARVLVERQASLADAPAMAEAGDLEERVRALLDRGRNRSPLTRRVAVAIAVLTCALALPVATLTTYAQAGRGALAGIIQDPSGARVPGSSVTAKNLDGTNEEVAVVNPAGEYGFASIPAGRYAIEVRAPGFKPGKKEIVVVAGAASRADVALAIGEISESVTIRGARTAPAAAAPRAMGTPQRIPVGGNVQAAKLLTQTRPDYPADLKQQGVTGTVTIRAIISKNGEPLNPQVISTVHQGLAQAALDAVKTWRYQPTLLNGQPVEVLTTISVAFELDQ
jgi:TonB family protein